LHSGGDVLTVVVHRQNFIVNSCLARDIAWSETK